MSKEKLLDRYEKTILEMNQFIAFLEEEIKDEEKRNRIMKAVKELIKQQIKKACECYLRYRNDPYTFFDEFPEKFELFKKESGTNFMPETHYEMLDYNKWLFELVFKFVFEEGEDYD